MALESTGTCDEQTVCGQHAPVPAGNGVTQRRHISWRNCQPLQHTDACQACLPVLAWTWAGA